MAALRPVEERDAKGNTIRINPAITYKQDRQIRVVIGRHDWRLDDNPEYHPPITAQVQDGKIRFFGGVPDSSVTRSAAKELTIKFEDDGKTVAADSPVPAYIVAALRARPIRVREPRPTVYEVKLAVIGDVEVAEATEIASDGTSVTVTAVDPDVNRHLRRTAAGNPAAPAAPIEATL
jgi:hypothetical protein